ncbi:MAG: helicase [Synechococcaceae cyanobacterium]|nr:helicase [Synechococcaceae cyanobacterium]
MLEASAHQQLKALLQQEGARRWPHHLTLSRLVARSLRRGDHTMVRLAPGTDPSWWISLLVPLALSDAPLALVLSDRLRRRLLQVEWPRLAAVGLSLPCWEGAEAPPRDRLLWLLNHGELLGAWSRGLLADRQLVIPEAEQLEDGLRRAMAIRIDPEHWELLRRVHPAAEAALLTLRRRLGERVLGHPRQTPGPVPLAREDQAPLRHLLGLLDPLPEPWERWRQAGAQDWAGWASVEPAWLHWHLHAQPLEPLAATGGLLRGRGAVLTGELGIGRAAAVPFHGAGLLGLQPQVELELGDPPLADPLPLYAPQGQPLPNHPGYGEHLLDHCRRLVLGQAGLTVILVDDPALRQGLASGLAAEFGSRVDQETTAAESNGVICSGWNWWLEQQARLPLPCQLVVGLLPIASLEDPLMAARVEALRRQGRDWFRELLLPEALNRLQRGVAGLRRGGGRLAVLDGRLRGREWGNRVLAALEPWVALPRLLPN